MAFINLLKNGYRGKLGETVGQKWKNELTLRTYQGTNNSKSEAQLTQRAIYKAGISSASVVYNNLHNIEPVKVKNMNYFNYITSLWLKSGQDIAEFSKNSEWYRPPTTPNHQTFLWVDGGHIYSFFKTDLRLNYINFPNYKVQGVLLYKNPLTNQLESAIPYLHRIGIGNISDYPGFAGSQTGIFVEFTPPPGNVFEISFQASFDFKGTRQYIFVSGDMMDFVETPANDIEFYDNWILESFNN